MTALPLPANTRAIGTGNPPGDIDALVSILGALLGVAVDGTGVWNSAVLGTAAFQPTTAFDAAGVAAGLVAPLLQNKTATLATGFALQNATPTILSWTAPNDGNMHRAMVFGSLNVTSAETGGLVLVSWTAPGNVATSANFMNANLGTGVWYNNAPVLLAPGTTISLAQSNALTAGAATLWAEIWAS